MKHLCYKWHENHFPWVEVSGSLHTLRLVRRLLSACLYATILSSGPKHSRRLGSKMLVRHFWQTPKVSLCFLCPVYCVLWQSWFIMMSLRHCRLPGCDLKCQRVITWRLVFSFTTCNSILCGNSQSNTICLIGLYDFWNTIERKVNVQWCYSLLSFILLIIVLLLLTVMVCLSPVFYFFELLEIFKTQLIN
jgi:hypothetical protein